MEFIQPILQGFISNPWIILLLLVGLFFKFFRATIKGKIGEGVVNLAAKLRLNRKEYILLKDVTIPTSRGTTQIDHVVLSRFGIFVIETKNYSGWIYGNATDPTWTQVCHRKKSKFQNPLRQNNGHILALAELLHVPKETFHNMVCFIGDATFKTQVPDGVFFDGRYTKYIKSFKKPVLSHAELGTIRDVLESGRLKRGIKTDLQHVRNLKRRGNASPKKAKANESGSVNHEKLEVGLKKYCRIQSMFWDVDVSQSREFQKSFNGFYRVRRNPEWQSHFYGIMEKIKTEDMDYEQVLRHVHEKTGNIEASFCSKLIATRHPDHPIIDQFVLENLGMELPKPYEKKDRLGKTVSVYKKLVAKYETMLKEPKHIQAVNELRQRYPMAESISDVKALDLIMWQTR